MPNALAAAPLEQVAPFTDDTIALDTRAEALRHYLEEPSGRERPSRFWRIDLDAIGVDDLQLENVDGSVTIECTDKRVRLGAVPPTFGRTKARTMKFGALAVAFANRYAFINVPAGIEVEGPIVITYRAEEKTALFPYASVSVGRDARVTILERIEGGEAAFICGLTEIVTDESSDVTIASIQTLPEDARCLVTRAASPGQAAHLSWATADLGAALTVSEIGVDIEKPGADIEIASLFFPRASQHIDIRSTVAHDAGDATSATIVKSAAIGRGQARYVGNIRIAAHAQGSNASLRDDALLLSPQAHVDSVPALEIGANDVKAFHGATVGALDEEMLFYMTTRGITRDEAERMVALGFFEPAIERFPTERLRDEIRNALTARAG